MAGCGACRVSGDVHTPVRKDAGGGPRSTISPEGMEPSMLEMWTAEGAASRAQGGAVADHHPTGLTSSSAAGFTPVAEAAVLSPHLQASSPTGTPGRHALLSSRCNGSHDPYPSPGACSNSHSFVRCVSRAMRAEVQLGLGICTEIVQSSGGVRRCPVR